NSAKALSNRNSPLISFAGRSTRPTCAAGTHQRI
ncbi:uncharacterized protein METZ01_LOCUS471662, partial [marine metagenome]